jgi:hypothetical protein
MPDFKKMYTHLFNKVTDAISILQSAQAETEEMFMEQGDPKILLLGNEDEDKDE